MRFALLAILIATPAMADDYLDKLVPALAKTADAKTAIGTPPKAIKLEVDGSRFTLTIPATDTKHLIAAWKWQSVFAVSGDVHQTTFHVRRSMGVLEKNRLVTTDPNAGRWTIHAKLVKRPAGALPKNVSGASPAYDLPKYASQIDQIEISPRDIDELEDVLKTLGKPTMADVLRELGPEDKDVGSGIHVLEYQLGDTTIHVGTPDRKKVMYIKFGDRDVYRQQP